MSSNGDQAHQRHDAFAALRQRNFRFYAASRLSSAVAMTLLQATLLWQIYDITGSTLWVGILGLVQFAPSLAMTLIAGAVADSFDRRRIVVLAQLGAILAVSALTTATLAGEPGLWVIFLAALGVATVMAFDFPARQALLPSLVPPETFPQAITTGSTIQQLGFVSGPAVAGFLIRFGGIGASYAVYVGLIVCSVLALLALRPRRVDAPKRAVTVSAIREGVSFVWRRQAILGCMTLDMFAVIFGGAQALLPVYAKDILDVGALGYGVLLASLDAGALVMAVALVALPPIRRSGLALLFAVAVFGLATMAFGLSRSLPLSVALYAVIGMADQVSVVMRQTTIQLATPDELRGRVSSVNSLFIGASNRLGAVESGFVAAATSATFAVVSGGAGCLAVVGLVWAKMPELRNYRIEPRTIATGPTPATAAATAAPSKAALPDAAGETAPGGGA
ncbi:MAG: MFS transporter [Dehalococcoidia bacterium]|nr:MFS transporter [Dehalococcoidia bacterium]